MQRLALIACASVTCLMSQASASPLDSEGIATDLSFIETQVSKTLTSLGSPASGYPVSGGDSGTWTTTTPSSGSQGWTTGFFPGQLWLLYQATGSPQWLAAARQWTAPLASQASAPRVDPTDIGFIIGTSFGNGYRLTGDPSYKGVLTTAGNSLASFYNSNVGAVRSWTFPPYQPPSHFAVIVDSMMTLGPLQWGASNGGNPAWAGIASTHAQTVTTNLVRPDGSTFQVADFNPATGALMSRGTFSGFSDTSTWARGEAWALYGFVLAYQTSDNPAFLTTAEDVASYFVDHSPANGIPPWDFDAPGTQPVDTSAAAIAADGLVMLSTVAGTDALKMQYLQDAENILGSLSDSYLGPPSGESVLFDGFPGVNGMNTALIYGDYYFTEALLRLQDVLDGKPGWVLYSPTTVPESSTWAMMLLGFAGVSFAGYHRARVSRGMA